MPGCCRWQTRPCHDRCLRLRITQAAGVSHRRPQGGRTSPSDGMPSSARIGMMKGERLACGPHVLCGFVPGAKGFPLRSCKSRMPARTCFATDRQLGPPAILHPEAKTLPPRLPTHDVLVRPEVHRTARHFLRITVNAVSMGKGYAALLICARYLSAAP